MNGSALPVASAHGEGRAAFTTPNTAQGLLDAGLVPLRYTTNRRVPTEAYPYNPNGSPLGIAGVRTPDGRALAMMPHPERTVLGGVGSYVTARRLLAVQRGEEEFGPWVRMFRSARRWVG